MNPSFTEPELIGRLVILLTMLMLVVQLMMVTQRTLTGNIHLFALQSLLLAIVAGVVAALHHVPHLYILVALTVAGKVIALPMFFKGLVRRINVNQELKPLVNTPTAMVLCGGLTVLGYLVARKITFGPGSTNSAFGIAVALTLMGIFLMINRRTAITQVLALVCVENGLVLGGIALTTAGMPLVVDLGIFFDLFVAIMVLGILVFRIRETFASIDVERLNELKG